MPRRLLQHHAIDDGRLAPHLRHRQQVTVRLGQQRGVERRLRPTACTSAMPFSGTISADRPTFRCSVALATMAFRSLALSGLLSAAAGDRQQHFQIVVLLEQRAVQIQDLVARHQFAPQAFDRRLDQRLHEREGALLGVAVAGSKLIATTANGVGGIAPSSRRSQNR